ncbi:hypothetical protein [Pelagibius sp. 7325]|uniref:hypothetical protein n=1 Tax=Pelagibius sp. 7325 TaxID=3131994 RepID=UPI0030EF8058
MVRTATILAALSFPLGLGLSLPTASAEPLSLTCAMEAVRQNNPTSNCRPAIRVTDETPADESLVNRKNGKTITVEMVQNDVAWREQTAVELKQDTTSEAPR